MPPPQRQWQTVISGCVTGVRQCWPGLANCPPQSSSHTLTYTLTPRRKQAPTPPSTCSHSRIVSRYSHILTHLPTHMSTHTQGAGCLDPSTIRYPDTQVSPLLEMDTQTSRGPRKDFRHPFPSQPLCFKGAAPMTRLALLAPQEIIY